MRQELTLPQMLGRAEPTKPCGYRVCRRRTETPFKLFLEHTTNVILKLPSAKFNIWNICGSASTVPLFPWSCFLACLVTFD